MTNVFSLADRRARATAKPLAPVYADDDIAFPSEGANAPVQTEPEAELEPEPDNVTAARAAAVMVAAHDEPEPELEPSGAIRFYCDRLELELPAAMALLAFACKDATRAHLGIGIHGDSLCATDGHTLLVLEQDGAKARPGLQRKVWSRSYVETAAKVARARKSAVTLSYADLLQTEFPPVAQVIPEQAISATGPIGINPEYLARLTLMGKACGVDGVKLVSAGGGLDPVAFATGRRGELRGLAVIMPMRI